MTITAMIDLGSNSVRMDIIRLYPGAQYDMLLQTREMVRLSEGMTEDLLLKEEPIRRTIDALQRFCGEMERFGVTRICAAATAGVRKAKNKAYFLRRVREETGIALRVISGRQEAVYDFLGVMGSLKIADGLILDTGGGSTELIWVKQGALREAVSVPMGAVSLSEQFFSGGEDEASRRSAREFVRAEMQKIPWLGECGSIPIIGLGGSVRTLAKISIKLDESDDSLHGYELSAKRVRRLCGKIEGSSAAERVKMRGMDADRADIIAGGLLPLCCLMDTLGTERVIFSNHGLRSGLLFEVLGEQYQKMLQFLKIEGT